jgi:hypothetical protein
VKVVALFIAGAITLGGMWIIDQSAARGNPWYWTLCEAIIFLLGITTLQTIATHGPGTPVAGTPTKKLDGMGCESN